MKLFSIGALTGRFHEHPAVQSQANARGWGPSFASSGNFGARPIHRPSRTWTGKKNTNVVETGMCISRHFYRAKQYSLKSFPEFAVLVFNVISIALQTNYPRLNPSIAPEILGVFITQAHLSTTPSAGFSCPCPIEMLMNFPVHIRRSG